MSFNSNTLINRYRLRPSYFIAGIAVAVTLATAVFAELQNRAVHREAMRAAAGEQLGQVRAQLEGNINSNLQLVRGLVAVIANQPDIDQEQFSQIASQLIGDHSQLRNIAAAPDLVISLMYPLAGNEKAIGLDYRKNEQQRTAALQAVEAKRLVLAGPVNLLQGGRGFIGRFPVHTSEPDGSKKLWGLVSAVVDETRLYADSGLLDPDLPLDIAIAGKDADLNDSDAFFGGSGVFSSDPVITTISLPSGGWTIAAVPRGGWDLTPGNAWLVRGVVLFGGLLLVVPILGAGQLYDERQRYHREAKLQQEETERLSQRLRLALDTSKIGIWEYHLETGVLTWDRRMKELYDVPENTDPSGYNIWSDRLHPEDRERAEAEYWSAIHSNGVYHSEFRVMLQDGSLRWIRAIGAVHQNKQGQRYIVGVNWDVSKDVALKKHLLEANKSAELRNEELEAARAQMEHNALHDSLTGLPNRRFLDQRLMDADPTSGPTALLHIDLDRFKHINDTLGHAAGDAMLVHTASILKSTAQDGDFVARIGGDEFVFAVTRATDEMELSMIADQIITRLSEPVPYENHLCRFGGSVGIAMLDEDSASDRRNLLIDADIALYRAKSNGRSRYEFFSGSLKAEIVRTKRVADDILTGLEQNAFVPFFQPQFDAATLKVVGVEALARWRHPKDGLLAPDRFMKTADDLNVVPLIDRTILEQTLWSSLTWKLAGLDIPKVSVNVSAGRLADPDLFESLKGLSFTPGTLSFELLESIFLDEEDPMITSNLKRLQQMGIDIEIDDFGTGYASIVSLLHLRPARLKIDRQFIHPLLGSNEQQRLVASIIDIGKSFDIEVVAEGVETMDHARVLRDLGCDILQGYALGRPMPSDELIAYVKAESWKTAA
ncbi:bifunctional diguanylate cyclase/phosphodiesterase [Roseibium sp.]|uniref:bifunctional diguanylate cyclase/phosphodiesterase n=1 Tax=Roseibium sp. TaxID=1936156 RepID=UPI003D0D74AA